MPVPISELLPGRTFERKTPSGNEKRKVTERVFGQIKWRRVSRDGRHNPTIYASTEEGFARWADRHVPAQS